MKKFCSLIIALILGTGLVSGVGCAHKHEFGAWYTKLPATCTREGIEQRDCATCDESVTRKIDPLPHTVSERFSADGTKHWKECSVCHQHFEEGEHNFTGNLCSVCQFDKNGTEVLEYELNADEKSYSLTGVLGTAPETVVIPDSYVGLPVTRIAKGAFREQLAMKNITLSRNLTEIGAEAFDGCALLERIELPVALKTIGSQVFRGCSSLKSVTVASGNGYFLSVNGILYDLLQTKFIFIPEALEGEVVIPNSIRTIETGAFAGRSGITKVTVGQNVEKIGEMAFQNCRSMTEFTVVNSSATIGEAALNGCSSLQKITLASTWQSGLDDPYENPNGTVVGDSYFGFIFGAEFCLGTGSHVPASLKTVEITGGEELHKFMFYGCESIEEITLSASVVRIGDGAFRNCKGLKRLNVAGENPKYGSRDGVLYETNTRIHTVPEALEGEIEIPEGVTQVGAGAFQGRKITSVSLPASLQRIASTAFYECTQLRTVAIPEESNLISFGDECFSMCSSLESIVIPAKTTTIGNSAFIGCDALKNAYFKETEGWSRAASVSMDGSKEVPSATLANPNTAAQELNSAGSMYYWSRKSA